MTSITIDNDEYIGYINKVTDLTAKIMDANGMVKKLEDELSFIKSNSDGVLVVVKEVGKPEKFEFKSTEKQVITQIVVSNNKLLDIYNNLSEKISLLENLVKEQDALIEKVSREKEIISQKNDQLKKRSLLDRILNKVI